MLSAVDEFIKIYGTVGIKSGDIGITTCLLISLIYAVIPFVGAYVPDLNPCIFLITYAVPPKITVIFAYSSS